jgi:hypothetical protein
MTIRRLPFLVCAAGLAFCAALSLGCVAQTTQSGADPVSPGQGYAISPEELPKVKEQALHGDTGALNRMIEYYMLYVGDEVQGVQWLERLGDIGDVDARKSVLIYYQKHPSQENLTRLQSLKARWHM